MMKIIKILISSFIILLLFLNLYPPLGRRTNKEKVRSFTTKENFAKGKFQNQIPASQAMSLKHTGSILRDFIKPNPKRRPDRPIVIGTKEPASVNSNKITCIWSFCIHVGVRWENHFSGSHVWQSTHSLSLVWEQAL